MRILHGVAAAALLMLSVLAGCGGKSVCAGFCNGACTAIDRDPLNCGTCGARCPTGICYQKQCVGSCPSGTAQCGGTCADIKNDALNCGQCGNS